MGTNYYFEVPISVRDDKAMHIGKMSSLGTYCLRCRRVCNETGIPHDSSQRYDDCPVCHNHDRIAHKCSFTWAIKPSDLLRRYKPDKIFDEYGESITMDQFMHMLKRDVGYYSYYHIGANFS